MLHFVCKSKMTPLSGTWFQMATWMGKKSISPRTISKPFFSTYFAPDFCCWQKSEKCFILLANRRWLHLVEFGFKWRLGGEKVYFSANNFKTIFLVAPPRVGPGYSSNSSFCWRTTFRSNRQRDSRGSFETLLLLASGSLLVCEEKGHLARSRPRLISREVNLERRGRVDEPSWYI